MTMQQSSTSNEILEPVNGQDALPVTDVASETLPVSFGHTFGN